MDQGAKAELHVGMALAVTAAMSFGPWALMFPLFGERLSAEIYELACHVFAGDELLRHRTDTLTAWLPPGIAWFTLYFVWQHRRAVGDRAE